MTQPGLQGELEIEKLRWENYYDGNFAWITVRLVNTLQPPERIVMRCRSAEGEISQVHLCVVR